MALNVTSFQGREKQVVQSKEMAQKWHVLLLLPSYWSKLTHTAKLATKLVNLLTRQVQGCSSPAERKTYWGTIQGVSDSFPSKEPS